jgi:excisionase family DNA binding protein
MRVAAVTEFRQAPSTPSPLLAGGERKQRNDPLLFTVEEAADQLLIGRSLMYELIRDGHIGTVRIGRLRRVPREALAEFVVNLRSASRDT